MKKPPLPQIFGEQRKSYIQHLAEQFHQDFYCSDYRDDPLALMKALVDWEKSTDNLRILRKELKLFLAEESNRVLARKWIKAGACWVSPTLREDLDTLLAYVEAKLT